MTKKIVIAPQTKVALVGYILVLSSKMVFLIINPNYTPRTFIPYLLSFILISALGLYSLNCMVVGDCNSFAWIVSYLIVTVGILIIMSILLKFKFQKI